MSKFKVGDKVVEISTGDVGVITRICDKGENAWYVDWEPILGELWIRESGLEHYQEPTQKLKLTQQDIQFLETILRNEINLESDNLRAYKKAASEYWHECDGTEATNHLFGWFSCYNTQCKQAQKKLKKLAELQAKVKRMKG